MIFKTLLVFFSIFMSTGLSIPGDISKEEILLGEFKRADLEQKPYAVWFNRAYKNYQAEEKALKTIKKNIGDYNITLFMGTWCPDSRREIPQFYKLLDLTGYDSEKIKAYAVNRNKETPKHLEKDFDVKMVPTIIFSKNGEEVNRFVEFSIETFAKDIAQIVSEKEYKNPYSDL